MLSRIAALILLLASGCTHLSPQNQLFEELDHEIPEEYLEESVNISSYYDVHSNCVRLGGNPIVAILGFPVLGCASLFHGVEEGTYYCEIWMVADWDWLYEHEHRHCLGYSDAFF